ncbi:MAG: FAD-dependent oxidoreductase [Actinomycetota bacterium]|nr:FAD-dependent oxidoreductase [Actinomycetota bacterium]
MLDLAVVGGGLAGTYAAYRVAQLRPQWSIGLFESSARVGGRLLSVRTPGIESVAAELGGMRYRTSQPLVQGIVDELGLETRPFPVLHEDNRYLLRGRHLRSEDFADPARVPYELGAPYERLSPAEAVVAAFETVVPGATDLSEDDWATVRREHVFRGKPLREWGVGDVLRSVLGADGYEYLVDGFGYTSIIGDWNAADAIPWFLIETRPDSENRTLVDGMERLPRELAARLERAGGSVHTGHHLVHVGRSPADPAGFRLDFGESAHEARRVVLALPQRPLERVARASHLLDTPVVRELVGSVTAHSMTKIFLRYDRPWWREGGLAGRRSVSDLPLRKTYFFDASPPERDAAALLLASYCNGPSVEHWRRFAHMTEAPPDGDDFESDARWDRYTAPAELVEEAHRNVTALHPFDGVPAPGAGAFMEWDVPPYEGAWHSWNVGAKSWEVLPRLAQPVPGEEIYVCGEACSSYQGWMEGALETAETVVRRIAGGGER